MIKVLICDDDKAVRDDIENIIKDSGYVDYVKKVKNGIDAIEFIKTEKIDLLIIFNESKIFSLVKDFTIKSTGWTLKLSKL